MTIKMNKGKRHLKDNDYSLKDEIEIYDKQLQDLFDNPREYLDKLDYLPEYIVRWKHRNSRTPTLPYKYVLPKDL